MIFTIKSRSSSAEEGRRYPKARRFLILRGPSPRPPTSKYSNRRPSANGAKGGTVQCNADDITAELVRLLEQCSAPQPAGKSARPERQTNARVRSPTGKA